MATKALRERRAKLVSDARGILDKAQTETRNVTPEEETKWNELHAEADRIKTQIERFERQETEERDLATSDGRRTDPERPTTSGSETAVSDHAEGLRAWLLVGANQQPTTDQLAAARRAGIDPARKEIALRLWPKAPVSRAEIEARALSAGNPAAGGHTIADEPIRPLEDALLAFGGVRQVATVLRTSTGANLPIPTSNDVNEEGMILAENTQVNEQDIAFSGVALEAFKYSSKMVRVSAELMQDSSIGVPAFVGGKLGLRIGRITNRHFTIGTGVNQPRGIVTASAVGKVAAGGQTTSITVEDLIDLEHSVDPAYRTAGRWMFHDTTLRNLKKLKDSQNRPLWLPGIAVKEPDTILGYPFTINTHMPLMVAGARSILFGDLTKYLIRDVLDITLLRLDERFAEFHQTAFLAFSRHDGDLLDAGTGPVRHFQQAAA